VTRVLARTLITTYARYWIGADAETWWTCGRCDYRLPVVTIKELVAYLNAGCPEKKTELLSLKRKLSIDLVGGAVGLAIVGLSVWQPIFPPLAMMAVLASFVIYLGYRK